MLIEFLATQAPSGAILSSSVHEPSGRLLDFISGDVMWVNPRILDHIVIFPARSHIPLLSGLDTDGQEHVYILILRTSYSNSWAGLAKVFNQI